jgi:hypothetical protein
VELIQMGSRIPTSTGMPRSHGDQQQRHSPVGLPRWLSLPVSDLSPSPLAHLLALISWQPDLEHGGSHGRVLVDLGCLQGASSPPSPSPWSERAGEQWGSWDLHIDLHIEQATLTTGRLPLR